MKYNKLLLKFALLALSVVPVQQAVAQVPLPAQRGDTLELLFRLRQSDVDLDYADNALRLERFMERLRQLEEVRRGDFYIKIYAGASPEGPAELNRRLGERRGVALRRLLSDRMDAEGMDIWCSRMVVVNEAARWSRLYRLVQQSSEPWRDRVLSVLRSDKPANASDWQLDSREEQLRQLDGGAVWRDLSERYLPLLRSVGTAVLTPVSEHGYRDTLVIRDTVYYLPMPGQVATPKTAAVHMAKEKERWPLAHDTVWALKTNVLMLGVATPNIQVERPLGKTGRWSIAAEVAAAWWTLSHNAYANQLLYGGAELRLWLGNRKHFSTLSGWHVGLAVAGGIYDIEWRSEGYQGEAVSTFLNIGWQYRMGKRRRWLVDIGVGLGGLFTRYREYKGSSLFPPGHEEQHDDHLMWQRNGHLNWLGAPHANISIGRCF